MKESLTKLVDACIETHVSASSTSEAKRHFKTLIQYAHDIGFNEAKDSFVQMSKEAKDAKPKAKDPKNDHQLTFNNDTKEQAEQAIKAL